MLEEPSVPGQIFALAQNAPLVTAIERLLACRPPKKSAELIAAEQTLSAARQLHQVAVGDFRTACMQHHRAYSNARRYQFADRIAVLEHRVAELAAEERTKEEIVAKLAVSWKNAAAEKLRIDVQPLRECLAQLVPLLISACDALSEAKAVASHNQIAAPWIVREGETQLRVILRTLHFDADL